MRDHFAHKLNKGLKLMKLPLSFLSIFALAGIEPRKEARTKVRGRGSECVYTGVCDDVNSLCSTIYIYKVCMYFDPLCSKV